MKTTDPTETAVGACDHLVLPGCVWLCGVVAHSRAVPPPIDRKESMSDYPSPPPPPSEPRETVVYEPDWTTGQCVGFLMAVFWGVALAVVLISGIVELMTAAPLEDTNDTVLFIILGGIICAVLTFSGIIAFYGCKQWTAWKQRTAWNQ